MILSTFFVAFVVVSVTAKQSTETCGYDAHTRGDQDPSDRESQLTLGSKSGFGTYNWDGPIYDFKEYDYFNYSIKKSYYNTDMAMYALKLSYAGYSTKDELLNWNCGCCNQLNSIDATNKPFSTKLVINEGHNQAYVGVSSIINPNNNNNNENWIILTFRGTANTCGWICNDFHYNEVKYPGIKDATIHEGFYKVWSSGTKIGSSTNRPQDGYLDYESKIMPLIKELLNEYGNINSNNNDKCRIIVTGHSLGAALAYVGSLTVADYLLEMKDVISCKFSVYTYGAPRWGNSILSDYFNKHSMIYQHFRLVNGYDIVTILPPIKYFNFYHSTIQVWYENSSPNSPYIGNPIDGEENIHGKSLIDCIKGHSKSCLNDHVTYLGYTADNGKCTQVTISTIERIHNESIAIELNRKSSRATVPWTLNTLWNKACERICAV